MSELNLPTLGSPEDADACHRWGRAIVENWEADRQEWEVRIRELEDQNERLRTDCEITQAANAHLLPENQRLEAEVKRLQDKLRKRAA